MTEMPSYMIDNPKFESYKPKKRCYYSSSMLSIFLSIFTYILIFYVFEVSPSSIFKDTKVLFFITNALIFIIAVDYGAFTDKERHDFYGEYAAATAVAMRNRGDNYSPIPVFTYQENPRGEEIKNTKEEDSVVKEIVCISPVPENIVHVVSEEQPINQVGVEKSEPVNDQITIVEEACNIRNHVNPKSYGRTKSDKPRRMKKTEEAKSKRKSYRRSESDSSKWMVVPQKWENVEEESEEFSKMSNEELNSRFEEFIQQFNRRVRLQSRVLST